MASGSSSQFTGPDFYTRIKKHILTDAQLRSNGYPRAASDEDTTRAKYFKYKNMDVVLKENERICRRCTKRYLVKEDGTASTREECRYHDAYFNRSKVGRSIYGSYGCCERGRNSEGCQVVNSHVNEKNRYHNLTGYITTSPAPRSDDPRNTKVLALDCEMLFTKSGMDLARVTVVDDGGHVVYEALVMPDTDIIDYNTKFSGITARDYVKEKAKSQTQVQDDLFEMISDKTILIGHSLESDLTALKMIHSTVVDTSLVFPHTRGLPYKRALRNLVNDHLHKTIQNQAGGHDSKEDAVSCVQLMQYKVKRETDVEKTRQGLQSLRRKYPFDY